MSKHIIISILLGLTFIGQAQNVITVKGSGYILTQQRKTSFFHSIEVSQNISVYIVPGEFQPITVEADNNLFPYIKTIVRNQILKIYIPDTVNIAKFNDMNILISMPTIQVLQAYQNSLIDASPQEWNVKNIQLKASSGSRIKLAAHTSHIEINAKTSAIIELKGKAACLQAQLKSAARLYARDFEIEKAILELATRARAEIKVNEELEYNLYGNAMLIYRGNPTVSNPQINSGSKVIHNR